MHEFDLGADRLQSALTRRFLTPALPALETTFLALRAEADGALEAEAGERYGKPYPYGMCLEITGDVLSRLNALPGRPRSAGERALKAFFANGGQVRMVWGVLRERYFQNALQLGSLYVDVSNDTVDVRKAKVEILPMQESGLALVRDAAHFVRIGEAYWDVTFYANTALPSLAPAFPLIVADRRGRLQMQTKSYHMVRLFSADGFRAAERWLREGPPAPSRVVQALRAVCPSDLLADNPEIGAGAAIRACERLRAAGTVADDTWIADMDALFDRVPVTRIAAPALICAGAVLLDERRTNARPTARIVSNAA